MSDFKPEYAEQLAAEMMRKASNVVSVRTLIGALIGFAIGYALGQSVLGGLALFPALVGAGIAGLWAFYSAQSVVLALRAQAQLILTQLEIEKNTRPLRSVGTRKKA